MDPVILVDRITKRYGPTVAVRELAFSVEKGEIVGLLGPNGAGKTTTMRVIAGFMPPSEGRVVVSGHDVATSPLEARRRVGYLPETPPLYPEMEVSGFLEYAARLRQVPRRRVRREVDGVVEACGLGDARGALIGRLSRGFRQRVGIAQALVHRPEALVLDEPTAGLDPRQIHETRTLIRGLAGERTVILSTHILPEVAVTCDRVVIISRGRLRAEDSPGKLAARVENLRSAGVEGVRYTVLETPAPADRAARALRAAPGVSRVRAALPDGENVVALTVETWGGSDRRSELARTVLSAGAPLLGLREARASLEDVYLELTTDEPADAGPGTPAGAMPGQPGPAAAGNGSDSG